VHRLLAREGRNYDPRLAQFLIATYDFSRSSAWTASELLCDARRDRRDDLDELLADITGDSGDRAKTFGRWLQRHAGIEVAGYRIEKIKPVNGVWQYGVLQGPPRKTAEKMLIAGT